jgi:hypothetical protein
MNILKKPLKDWNVLDLGGVSLMMLGLVPVGFWVFCKGFDIIEKLDNKKENDDTEEDEG